MDDKAKTDPVVGDAQDQPDPGDNKDYQSPFMKLGQDEPPPTQSQVNAQDQPDQVVESGSSTQPGPADPGGVPMQSGGFENFVSGNADVPEQTITSPLAKKSATGKYIATILGVVLLVGGVAAGVFLVQRDQEIRRRAASAAECTQASNCVVLEDPGDSGTFQVDGIIYNVFLTHKEIIAFDESVTEDGCYRVNIEGSTVSWERIGFSSECKDISNIQIWTTGGGQTVPSFSAQCLNIRIYDTDWNVLSANELGNLVVGDTIRISVSGSTNEGVIDMARFIINGQLQPETTSQKEGSDEFYQEYTIPEGVETFSVNAQLHHSVAGWF